MKGRYPKGSLPRVIRSLLVTGEQAKARRDHGLQRRPGTGRWLLLRQAATGTFPNAGPVSIGDCLSEVLKVRVISKDREEGIPKGPGDGAATQASIAVTTKSPPLV